VFHRLPCFTEKKGNDRLSERACSVGLDPGLK